MISKMYHDCSDISPAPLKLDLSPTPIAVRDALSTVKSQWSSWGLDAEFCDVAELVLAEVLNNIVEHAFSEKSDGTIKVAAQLSDDKLHVGVRDEGLPMPNGTLPNGQMAEFGDDPDALPEGGFGWFMIRAIAQDLRYQRIGDWNQLSYTIARAV